MNQPRKPLHGCAYYILAAALILAGCASPQSPQAPATLPPATATVPVPTVTSPSTSAAEPAAATAGPAATASPEVTAVPAATAVEPCPQGKVTIKLDDWSVTEDGIAARDEVLAGFAAAYPCIQVEVVAQVEQGADAARLKQIQAGTASDLIAVESSYIPAYTDAGGLADLTPFIQADPDFKPGDFFQGVWKSGFYKDTPRAINKDFSTSAVYINAGLFEKAGIPLPQEGWTYDEYLNIAQQLTLDANGNNALSPDFDPDNIVQYGTTSPYWAGTTGWFRGFQNILYSFGAHSLDPQGTKTTGFLNSPAALRAWEFSRDLVHKYHVAPDAAVMSGQKDANLNLFKEGKLAMVGAYWGPWFSETLDATPGLQWTVAPLPAGPAGHQGVIMWMGWGLNARSEHPQEAWELLKWLTTEPGQRVFTRRAMTQYKPLAVETQRINDPFWGVFLAETEYVDVQDDASNARFFSCVSNGPVAELLYKIWLPDGDQIDIQAELDRLAAEADQCLAQKQ